MPALNFNINIPELYKSHFGVNIGFATEAIADKLLNGFKGVRVLPEGEFNTVTPLGAQVWDYIKINPTIIEGTGENFSGYSFPLESVIEAVRPKNIVETTMVGFDGEVEELMSLSNWQINIRGFIINYESEAYPEQAVKRLKQVCELKSTDLPVEGTFLNMLKIYQMSIHRLHLRPLPGYSHVQPFEIEARSKIPFSLKSSYGILL